MAGIVSDRFSSTCATASNESVVQLQANLSDDVRQYSTTEEAADCKEAAEASYTWDWLWIGPPILNDHPDYVEGDLPG